MSHGSAASINEDDGSTDYKWRLAIRADYVLRSFLRPKKPSARPCRELSVARISPESQGSLRALKSKMIGRGCFCWCTDDGQPAGPARVQRIRANEPLISAGVPWFLRIRKATRHLRVGEDTPGRHHGADGTAACGASCLAIVGTFCGARVTWPGCHEQSSSHLCSETGPSSASPGATEFESRL